MSAGWLNDGPLWDRQVGERSYLHVAGPLDDGRFYAAAVDEAGRRNTNRAAATAAEARDWADRHVTGGRVVVDELAARRNPWGEPAERPSRGPRTGRTARGRSR